MSKVPPVLSPVDYDAWQRGYMPPTEHIVIDQLSYRGARVIAGSDHGERGWWLVIKGPIDQKTRRAIQPALALLFETLPDDQPPPEAAPGEGFAITPDDTREATKGVSPDATEHKDLANPPTRGDG